MNLNFNNKLEEYYQKFIELQEKLKRSEEQRFLLEMKFNEMTQVAKEEEQTHYRKLRAQYKRFLEEDQKRQDRNERIIRNLERIETKISMLSAKTERINMLRRQYQNYLRRIANSSYERKPTESQISRERSFIKEEPLKEQQLTAFRDDYSVPERSKETGKEKPVKEKLMLEKPVFEHPSVKKALEKDRSNEEKIEILDKYLQSISSQRCRDILNQERQARGKLSLDTPVDIFLKDDFQPNPTNHATAVADDIMNSIYSRYYTKTEVSPKGEKADFQKERLNERKDIYDKEKSDYDEKQYKLDGKSYLDLLPNKNSKIMSEKSKPAVSFKEDKGDDNILKYSVDIFNNSKTKPDEFDYPQDQSKHYNSLSHTEHKQNLKFENNNVENYRKNDIQTLQSNDESKNMTNYLNADTVQVSKLKNMENKIQHEVKDLDDNLAPKNESKIIDTIINNPINTPLEGNKISDCFSTSIKNSSPKIISSDSQNPLRITEDKIQQDPLKQETEEQLLQYNPNDQPSHNKDQLHEQDHQKHQSEKQLLENNFKNDPDLTEEPVNYDSDRQHYQTNQQNEPSSQNENNLGYQEITKNDLNNQPIENNQDQSPVQYDLNNELSVQPDEQHMQYDQNTKPYDQNQYNENIQPQYHHDSSVMQYDEHFPQPVQYDENRQPLTYAENDQSYQQIQYNENEQPVQYNENEQPIQYDANGQPIQYDENGQPIGYDQYGQPLLYDQNGQIVQPQYDENGQIIPQYDENGQLVMLYDQNGQLVFNDQYQSDQQQYDITGQPIAQYDENGQPIYDQNQPQYYDYTNQGQTDQPNEYNQSDDLGHFIENGENQLHNTLENINQHQIEESNNYKVGDQEFYPETRENQESNFIMKSEVNLHQIEEAGQSQISTENNQDLKDVSDIENKTKSNKVDEANEDEKNNERVKPANVMDILDTDTESAKQNTSKISNDSDFDFS